MSSKRARRASSPHPVTPFVAAIPTSPLPSVVAQGTPVSERKTPRPRSIQASPDVRPRRSSLKPAAVSQPAQNILDRFRNGDSSNTFSGILSGDIPQTPPLPSYLNASTAVGVNRERSSSRTRSPVVDNRGDDAATSSPYFARISHQRDPKPPPSPGPTSTSRARSKSKSRREPSELQDSESESPVLPKLDFRLPVSIQEQNNFSDDSPSPRPSRSTVSSRVPLKSSRRAVIETDNVTPMEPRRYSHRVPVPRGGELSTPDPSLLSPEPVTSPPRDLQKLGHFRVVNADPYGESSDDLGRSGSSRFSPIPRQTPPVEFQRRFPFETSQLQSGRGPANESGPLSPLTNAHRSPSASSGLPEREKLLELWATAKTEPHRSDDRRERRKSHSVNDMRKASLSVPDTPGATARPPGPSDSPASQPRTPQLSSRAFTAGAPKPESLTPRSSRPPQSQIFPSSSPSPTTTVFDTTPRRGALSKESEARTDKKPNRSRRNTEVKQVDASPKERSHALRGLFDKLGLGFAFEQAPQEIGLVNDCQSSIPTPSLDHPFGSTDDFGEQPNPMMPVYAADNKVDRQTALFAALSSTSPHGRLEPEPEDFYESSRPISDEGDERDFVQVHVLDDDDGNAFGLTAATSLNRISASPNPDAASDPTNGRHVSQSNIDDLYFSLEPLQTNVGHPASSKRVSYDHAPRDRERFRGPRDSNSRAPSRGPREDGGNSQYGASWTHGYDSRLPSPPPPASSPSIVIQPSTSISSNDALPRAPSIESMSQYSDNESVIEDREATNHHSWSPDAVGLGPEPKHSKAGAHDALYDASVNGGGVFADKRSTGIRQPDGRSQERSQSSHSSIDDASSGSGQPTIDKPLASAPKTWKSTLPADALRSLLEKYGAIEMRRQEVLWELCNTEQEFVESLRTILRLFVQPLRTKDGKWIPGLPPDVSFLFDSLDDIVDLHSRISTALLDKRSTQYPIVLHVAEALRTFVPHLEVHQPYLVRLEVASQLIAEMAQDRHSDLGEFIRIQTASPECAGMPLSSFLLKPIQRLMKYPLFFKRLLELTPRNHADYLATFSLMHSTDMVIKVMQEVKAREDEYDLVKSLTERIRGLPDGFLLASRERRLIAQGLLRRVSPNEKDRVQFESSPASLPGPTVAEPLKPTPATPSQTRLPFNANMNKLFPITSPRFQQPFDPKLQSYGQYSRPDSMASDLSTEPSFGDAVSDGTRSTTSSSGIVSPSTTAQSMRPDSIASSCASFDKNYMSRDPYAAYQESAGLRRRSSLRSLKGKHEVPIYAFVFTDLVLLTAPVSERNPLRSPKSGESKDSWRVLDDVGISRVLGVKNLSGKLDHDHLLSIDLLPMTPGQDRDLLSSPYAITVYISLPERMTSRMALAPPNILEEARLKWFDAFNKCSSHTFRSLCFPPKPGSDILGSLSSLPKSRESVFAMLSSGTPLLRSPSQLTMNGGRRPDEEESPERLERQWWSEQFQKVMREMERGEIPWMTSDVNSTMAVQPQHRRTADPKRASVMGGPRPLLLGSKLSSTSATEERKGGLLRSLSRKGR